MNREIFLHIIRLLLLLILVIVLGVNVVETYRPTNKKKSNFHLYPIKGNTRYCSNKGFDPAYMPTECYLKKGGKFKLYPNRNCRCVHKKTGICSKCYPHVKQYH